jgi:hypothetical protein
MYYVRLLQPDLVTENLNKDKVKRKAYSLVWGFHGADVCLEEEV